MIFNLFILVLGYLTFGFIMGCILNAAIESIKKRCKEDVEKEVDAAFERGAYNERGQSR